MSETTVTVGGPAPDFVLRAGRGAFVQAATGIPRVLAFVRQWSPDAARPELREMRSHLRGLGAELVVLARAGVWSFRPDDDLDQLGAFSDRLAADIATAALLYGVRGGDAVFVIDGDGTIQFAHRPGEPLTALADALSAATDALCSQDEPVTFTRREWVTSCLVAGFAFTFLRGCKEHDKAPPAAHPPQPAGGEVDVTLDVNGRKYPLRIEPRVSLLDALRERIGLTGTKKGCDMGQCGACTVHVGGRRELACLTLAVMAEGKSVTTIEGLATGDKLHPMQQAFVEHDALQCGFCTPGQIMSAVALLSEKNIEDVRAAMSGNICRCGAYPNIVAAIEAVKR